MRRKEIAGLLLGDIVFAGPRPCITVRSANTKGRDCQRKSRQIPLFWDAGTKEDLKKWVDWRVSCGATPTDLVVCGVSKPTWGKPLTGLLIAKRWRTAIRILGKERVRQVPVHAARHSYASLTLEAGHSLVSLRDALGHSQISTTSVYLHAMSRNVPDVFAASQSGVAR
jgi:site-specific recombinase XerC